VNIRAEVERCSALALLSRQLPAVNPPVLVPDGATVRLTNTRLATGRAEAPPAAAVMVMVAHPWGASPPPVTRPFQRTVAELPLPL
jgi:hypothetical protein